MKRGKQFACFMLSFVMVLSLSLSVLEVKAGMNEMVLNSATLNDSNWNNAEEDIEVKEGVLIFSEDSTEYTRYISKQAAKKEEGFTHLTKMSATVKFSKLPSGKKFIFAFGLPSVEAIPGEGGNVEVAFWNQGGIKVGITAYDEEGNEKSVLAGKSSGISMNSDAKIEIVIGVDSSLQLTINGKRICSAKLPVTGEGRVGFLQTGGCAAKISNLTVTHYRYDRPENVTVSEDFENGDMDSSKLTAKMLGYYSSFPMGQKIEEYNGNQVMMFRNTSQAYIGTVYQYSNFEMTFDVPFMQIEDEFDEDGNLTKKKHGTIMVSFGGEQSKATSKGWTYATDAVLFSEEGVCSNNNSQEYRAKFTKDPYKENGRPFSIKVSVVDGVVTAGMKWMEEKEYETLLTYKLNSGMPLGYVHIWAPKVGYMAIDNIKVTNLDNKPNVIETEYESGKWNRPEDAVYTPMEKVYQDVEASQSEKLTWKMLVESWYVLIPLTLVIGGSAVIVSCALAHKKKNGKEVKADEV